MVGLHIAIVFVLPHLVKAALEVGSDRHQLLRVFRQQIVRLLIHETSATQSIPPFSGRQAFAKFAGKTNSVVNSRFGPIRSANKLAKTKQPHG